jgi:hypothetical protein
MARVHNRLDEHPEAPKRKRRRARTAKQLPAIFEAPMIPGLEPDAASNEPAPPPPTSHPAPPEAVEHAPPAPRIVVTDAE